jgi:beta-lactamase class A
LSAVGLLSAAMVGIGATQCSGRPPPEASGPPGLVTKTHPSFDGLQQQVGALVERSGASAGVTLVELGGEQAQTWSIDGDTAFVAASTYKLPVLMLEAERLAAGKEKATDLLCYQSEDWEDGWYTDYEDGNCYTRAELMRRIGQNSDNTAGHILVRYEGSTQDLNDYASSHGARNSAFYDPNVTTPNDLARLWVDEAGGKAGGGAAQGYLYPLLTHTSFENGIPAGVPDSATVVHKTGQYGDEVNDAALVEAGPRGSYVLVVCTQGLGGDPAWTLVADISRAVWRYEAAR